MASIVFNAPGPDFGEVPATRRVSCDVTVQNDQTTPINVALADNGGGAFRLLRAPGSIEPGQSATFSVGFHSDTVPSPAKVTGTLTAGAGTATVTATVRSPIEIEEAIVDCGNTLIDAGVISTVRVTNSHATAGATLKLEGADVFEVLPADVSPSAVGQAVWIRFRPTAEGTANATLTATVGTFSDSCTVTGKGVRETLDEDEVEGDDNNPQQRFYVDVPAPHTYLGLGASLGGQDFMAMSMNGVGLETEEDIFVNGVGGESKLFAQVTSNVVIQSRNESLYTSAKENNVQCAGEFSYVMGSKGVVIAAGLPLNYSSLSPLDGTHDTKAPHAWAMGFAATDAIVGTLLTALDGFRLAHEWKSIGPWGQAFEAFGRVATLTGAAMSAAGAADVVPAATVLGLAGVVVATPAFLAMYGLAGIGMVSTYPSMIGILDAAILAGRDATISALGGEASLQGREIEIRARREIAITASTLRGHKFAPIELEGSHIKLEAHKEVISDPNPFTNSELHETAGKIAVEAAKQVTVAVGTFLVKVTKTQIRIGVRTTEESEDFDPHKTLVTIDKKGVALRAAGASFETAPFINLSGKEATLASGIKSSVQATPAGIKLQAPDLKLNSKGPLSLKGGIIKLG
jgi:hypothetical protein